MIILLCSVRVFKRNININKYLLTITCMTNSMTRIYYAYTIGNLPFKFYFLGCWWLCLPWLSMIGQIINIFALWRTHGTLGVGQYLHAISTYFLVNQLLVHITVQRIGITYRVQCISPEDLLRLYLSNHQLSIK